ncbi:MarR family winged helix-turn-helix transcriptional regulator [Pontimicrobium sp. SW4]|uniref:MarR family winged helix-turn-helix transcriptional regulator n=1 Tax=Pontimicrobium sp. SW4 TaxID=3153519 RepID=A0AAU7BT85_9FLAO
MTNFTCRYNSAGFFMSKNVFNPEYQNKNISSKIVAGLERISEVFRVLLWDKAKQFGLSPIQIQILIFIAYHKTELCNVSHLAKEFNLTKPTISDAIRVLHKKEFIIKDFSQHDSRSYSILLSKSGKQIVSQTESFANPLQQQINTFATENLDDLFKTLSTLIYKLHKTEILTVQRTCFGCKFYNMRMQKDYCNLLEKELINSDIRIDCPEFEEKI